MPNRKVNKKRLGSGIVYAVIVLTILTTVLAGGVLAKYIKDNTQTKNVLAAKEFYFTSNLLTDDNEKYVISPSGDTASITFTLGNNADKLRFAEDDIAYTVNVTGPDVESLNGVAVSDESGTFGGGMVSTTSVTVTGLKKGVTYTVMATGTAGYKQTLKATIEVAGDDIAVYKSITQNSSYVLLTVWTKNVEGAAVITYPEGLIPDNTDPAMKTVKSTSRSFIDQQNSFSKAYSSHTYRFFINGATNIKVDSFTVTCNGVTAAPATPE